MFHQNCCTFVKIEDGQINAHGEKCGLYYKNLLELIHHIEEEHIPLIENAKIAERKLLREQFIDEPEQYEKARAASFNQPVPLSLIYKLKPFPKGHKVHPIAPPKQRILKFCHYKTKSITQQVPSMPNNVRQTTNSSLNSEILAANDQVSFSALGSKKISENQLTRPREASTSSDCITPDLLSGGQSPGHQGDFEDRKYRCTFDGCLKTYKNQQGLRHHMRTNHISSFEHSMQMSASKLSASEEGILSRQFPGRQSPFYPFSSNDSSTTKANIIQETPFLITTCAASMIVSTSSVSNTSLMRDSKYQCQQCASIGNELHVFKTFTALNKHLREAHGTVTLSPSRYSSGQHQKLIQIYSPHQSPQRPVSVGSSQQISMFQSQSSDSFIAPVMTMSRQQQCSIQPRLARPSAPIPPSTPPSPYSAVVTLVASSSTANNYSPQKNQIIQQQHRRQNHFSIESDQNQDQHVMAGGIQHYYTTSNILTTSNDQQPPVLQPQQQSSAGGSLSQQRFLRYTYQQPEQQIYSSHGTSPTYAYSSSMGGVENSAGTTTIYVTQQQIGPQQPSYATSNQMEYEQDSLGHPFYRQQPEVQHYLVEPTVQQQNSGGYLDIQSTGTRLIPGTSDTALRTIPLGGSNQQIGTQQQFHQTVYGTRNNIYGEAINQQSYSNTVRTASVQPQHRIFQQNQFYNQQRQGTRRQSPAIADQILNNLI